MSSLRRGMVRVTPEPPKKKQKKAVVPSIKDIYKRCIKCNDLMVKEAQPDKVCFKCKRQKL